MMFTSGKARAITSDAVSSFRTTPLARSFASALSFPTATMLAEYFTPSYGAVALPLPVTDTNLCLWTCMMFSFEWERVERTAGKLPCHALLSTLDRRATFFPLQTGLRTRCLPQIMKKETHPAYF